MREELRLIPLRLVDPGPYQPRARFDAEKIAELAASIRQQGLIQPIVVRPCRERYQLVAGERRARAARQLGLEEIPALVRPYTDEEALEAALVENIQREEITVVEQARAYERLRSEFGYTPAEIAQRTGKGRSTVSNLLRLLQLPEPVLALLDAGELTEGHGRALLGIPYPSVQVELADWVVRNAVPVRETERKVRTLLREEPAAEAARRPKPRNVHILELEERLRRHYGTRVGITYRNGRGTLLLEFYGDEDLERLLELMGLAETPRG